MGAVSRANEEFLQAFGGLLENGCLRSKSFIFRNTFLNDILLIMIDLSRSHAEGDQNLDVSGVVEFCHFSLPLTEKLKRDRVHCILNIVWH